MSMIYGCINNDNNALLNSFHHLEALMIWTRAKHHKIHLGNFSGGFYIDERLPYTPDDCCFLDELNGLLVLMSGTIYNGSELISKLLLKKKHFSNPELISIAYNKWGKDFVKRLNGDFIIFIHHKQSNTSYLFRDHMGVLPVSYYENNKSFWFSSDGMSLSKALFGNESIDRKFMFNLLIKHGLEGAPLISDSTLTPNRKIKKLKPGHNINISIEKTAVEEKFWSPEKIKKNILLDFAQTIEKMRNLLTDAVRIRCNNRFNAGAHVSSGLDSSVVASLARKYYINQKEFLGFCWSPNLPVTGPIDYDERELVKKLGQSSAIKPVFINIGIDERIKLFSEWRTITDPFQESNVRKIANSKQVNLIFSGWGGDEFISIENIGVNSDLLFNLHLSSFFKANSIKKPRKLISTLLYHIVLPAFSLRFFTLKKRLKHYTKYIQPAFFDEKVKTINDLFRWRSRRDMHLNYLYNYHFSERTEDWSILGLRNGIEYRYPLVDRRIVELMLQIPSKLMANKEYSRIIMREVSNGLIPEEIRLNISKIDPVRSDILNKLNEPVCIKLMDEIEDFRKNKELSFINFDLLVEDINLYKKGLCAKKASDAFEILFFLKKANEFTKKYHGNLSSLIE